MSSRVMPPALEHRPCPVCGAEEAEPHCFSAGVWRVVSCADCGMIYLRNPPPQAMLHTEHAWERARISERARRREGRRLYYFFSDGLKRLKHCLRGNGRRECGRIRRLCGQGGGCVLDVGCADGGTLRALAGCGGEWRLYGIEPSPGLAEVSDAFCASHGGRVETTTAAKGLPRFEAGLFDVVVMRSYLEHEANAGAVLREVARVLKPGGTALIKVPNAACWNARLRGAGWPGVRHPDHVNYFTAQDLRKLLNACGFPRCRFDAASRLPTSDNLWVTATTAS